MTTCTKCKEPHSIIRGIDKNTGLCWTCLFPRPDNIEEAARALIRDK